MRSATQAEEELTMIKTNFNPRTPCGVRRKRQPIQSLRQQISIHALHAECDDELSSLTKLNLAFQSTHSMRSATTTATWLISIDFYFNPRTPCGVRLSFDRA